MKSLTFVKTGKLVLFCFFIGFGCTPGSSPGGGVTPPTLPVITITTNPQVQWYGADTSVNYAAANAKTLTVNNVEANPSGGTLYLDHLTKDTTLVFLAKNGTLQSTTTLTVRVYSLDTTSLCKRKTVWNFVKDSAYDPSTGQSYEFNPPCIPVIFYTDGTSDVMQSICHDGHVDGKDKWALYDGGTKISLSQGMLPYTIQSLDSNRMVIWIFQNGLYHYEEWDHEH
jgi:hypothetical protein